MSGFFDNVWPKEICYSFFPYFCSLQQIFSFGFKRRPLIGIHPLGTGNDLAHVLGWGGKYVGDEHEIEELLQDFENADRVPFDR